MGTQHFNKQYWFVVCLVAFGLFYVLALTFLPIPKENIRFADTSIGWVQGSVVTMAISFLLGGNPADGKKTTTEVTPDSTKIIQEPVQNETKQI